jgi:hypothetical protein
VKIKDAIFFYNANLLDKICREESNFVRVGYNFVKDLNVGDIIKFIGNQKSCIVEVADIEPKDINSNCGLSVKLIKIIKGELEIDY